MPRFLLSNYLEEVRRQRNFFLSHWQVTIPSHLENVDSYVHNGTLHDYVYRLPWLRVNKDSLQTFTNAKELSADLETLTNVTSDCEKLQFPPKSILHIVHSDGEVSEVVPSSNPDSPPVDVELVAELEKKRAQNTQEDFFEDFTSSQSTRDDKDMALCLPEMKEPDLFQESLNKLPTLSKLCERLAAKAVPDPLIQNEMDIIRKDLSYGGKNSTPFTEDKNASGTTEVFQKENLSPSQEPSLLEQPEMCPLGEVLNQHQMNRNRCSSLSKEPVDAGDGINDNCSFLGSMDRDNKLEDFNTSAVPEKGLCALNSEGVRDKKKVTDRLAFENILDGTDDTKRDVVKMTQTLEREELPTFDDTKWTVSPTCKQQELSAKALKKDTKFLELPALRVQEPIMSPEVTKKNVQEHVTHQVSAMDTLGLTSEKITLDSSLAWNPLTSEVTKPMKNSPNMENYIPNKEDGDVQDGNRDADQATCKQDMDKVDLCQFAVWDQSDEAIPEDNPEDKLQADAHTETGPVCKSKEEPPKSDTENLNEKDGVGKVTPDECLPKEDVTSQNISSSVQVSNVPTNPSTNATKETKQVSQSDERKDAVFKPVAVAPMEKVKAKSINPLDDFLMLRTVPLKREAAGNISPKKHSKITKKVSSSRTEDAKTMPSIKQESKLKITKEAAVKSEKNTAKKSKSKQLEITLTDPFVDILGKVEMSAQPVLSHLRKLGIISTSYSLSSLTPDITRFLLKQHEKIQDTSKNKDEMETKLRCLLQLHALITTADLITHCDLTTAILHLSTVQDKYSHILQGSLDNIRQSLYKKQCILHKEKVMHPKLMTIIRQISDWYRRKLSKDRGDNDPKILVIIKRDARKLVEVVADALTKVQGINTSASESSQMMYDAISKQLDTCNCLVLLASQIGQDFPWAQFSLVVEYEYAQGSVWLELCERQNIRHIALKTMPANAMCAASGDDGRDAKKDWKDSIMEGADDASSQSQGGKALKMIASEEVISCSQLLQLLESRYDIMLLERNYAKMISDSASNKLYFADLIVDEQCGIVLQELHQLSEAHTVEPVVNRMTKLSLQFSVCWLVLYTDKAKHTGYPLGGQTVNNLSRLQAALTQFSTKNDGYEVKVLFADSLTEVAKLIRQIADQASQSTRNWNQTDWHARPWLTNTVSKHEKVLLQFPCLNAYTAQIMLTAATLQQLLMMTLDQLMTTCPWIKPKILQIFHSVANGMQKRVTHLSSDSSKEASSHQSSKEDQPGPQMKHSHNQQSVPHSSQVPADIGDDKRKQRHPRDIPSGKPFPKQKKIGGYQLSKDSTNQRHEYQRPSSVEIKQERIYGQSMANPNSNHARADFEDTKDSQDMTAIEFIATHIKQEPGLEPQPAAVKVPPSTRYDPRCGQEYIHHQSRHQSDFVPDVSSGVNQANGQNARNVDMSRAYAQEYYQRARNGSTSGHAPNPNHQRMVSIDATERSQECSHRVESIGAPRTIPAEYHHRMDSMNATTGHAQEHSQRMRSIGAPRANAQEHHRRMRSTDRRAVAPEHYQKTGSIDAQHYGQPARSTDEPGSNPQQYFHDSTTDTDYHRGAGYPQHYQGAIHDAKSHRVPAVSDRGEESSQASRYPARMVPSSASSFPDPPDHNLQHEAMYQVPGYQSQGLTQSVLHRGGYHQGEERDVQRQRLVMHNERSAPEVPSIPRHSLLPPERIRNPIPFPSHQSLPRHHSSNESWNTPRSEGALAQYHQWSFGDQSVPSSAEVEKEANFLEDYEENELGYEAAPESDTQQVPLTPSKKRRVTYERVPGVKNGQTRLTFY